MAISSEDYRDDLHAFARRAPEVLRRHPSTQGLADEVMRLDLAAQLQRRRFMVAVVGRMKAGKSTLLNALVGRDLAPVGVNETTATINWFDHDPGPRTGTCEIHWKAGGQPLEVRSIAAAREFIGRNAEARDIDHIRFFADSEFLQGVTLVDAPGTMSTIDSHEAATLDFLTRESGERADATILVLPTVVTRADKRLIEEFAEQTRFPGQGPYNTLAVLQKWETLNAPAPEVAAEALAADFRHRLASQVSDVLPVSGLMAKLAAEADGDDLAKVAFLGTHSAESDLQALLAHEDRFGRERDGLPLSSAERTALLDAIKSQLLGADLAVAAGAFEMMKFATGLAHRHGLRDGEALRRELYRLSNVDRLKALLEQRFFAMSSLIRAGSVLKKALAPCRTALFTLRDDVERQTRLVRRGEALQRTLPAAEVADRSAQVATFLDDSLPLLRAQIGPLDASLRELDTLIDDADRDFKLLMADLEALSRLGDSSRMSPEQVQQARRVCGQYGMERHVRLGLAADAPIADQAAAAAALHAIFAAQTQGDKVAQHVEERLALMLDDLTAPGRLADSDPHPRQRADADPALS